MWNLRSPDRAILSRQKTQALRFSSRRSRENSALRIQSVSCGPPATTRSTSRSHCAAVNGPMRGILGRTPTVRQRHASTNERSKYPVTPPAESSRSVPRRSARPAGPSKSRVPRYLFGQFVLSPRRRLLLRNGEEVPLIPRYFDLLVFLVEHRSE